MLNHEFTLREKLLLLVFSVFLVGLFVYEVAYVGINNEKKEYDLDQISMEISQEELRAVQVDNMKRVIEESEGKVVGTLSVYNNLSSEIMALNQIITSNTDKVSITWSEPVLSGTIIRRDANITFTAKSYDHFKSVLKQLSECQYRTLIRNVSITSGNDTNNLLESGQINCQVSMTFYETSEGASSLSGLIIPEE